MGVMTLVRHGQASLFAENYDELSALGRDQARLLGEFWAGRRNKEPGGVGGSVDVGVGKVAHVAKSQLLPSS